MRRQAEGECAMADDSHVPISRRGFFTKTAAMGAGVWLTQLGPLGKVAAHAGPAGPTATTAENLDRDALAEIVGSKIVTADDLRISLTVDEVTPALSSENCESFSLLASGRIREPLEQGTHRFRHRNLGEFDLFIVPVDMPGRNEQRYEAAFARLR